MPKTYVTSESHVASEDKREATMHCSWTYKCFFTLLNQWKLKRKRKKS